MELNNKEVEFIHFAAKCFEDNKDRINAQEVMNEMGISREQYEVLVKVMENMDIVEDAWSHMRERYASFRVTAYAQQLSRELKAKPKREKAQKKKRLWANLGKGVWAIALAIITAIVGVIVYYLAKRWGLIK